MFSRVRSWTDIAPWVALARTLRVLVSPTLIGMVVVAWIMSAGAFGWCFATYFPEPDLGTMDLPFEVKVTSPYWPNHIAEAPVKLALVTNVIAVQSPLWGIGFLALMVLIWGAVVCVVARQGAALTAARPVPGFGQTWNLFTSRCGGIYFLPIVPWACVLAFAVLMALLRLPSVALPVLSAPTGWLLALLAFPCALLAFGSVFAIPLGWSAMMNEPDPDPIDSLSRGYEYLLRRPLHLIWYLLVCGLLGYLVQIFFGYVAGAATAACTIVGSAFAADEVMMVHSVFMVQTVWLSAQITLQFALLGGVYLLLRRDAGGQHIEDLWFPAETPESSLPSLPQEAFES